MCGPTACGLPRPRGSAGMAAAWRSQAAAYPRRGGPSSSARGRCRARSRNRRSPEHHGRLCLAVLASLPQGAAGSKIQARRRRSRGRKSEQASREQKVTKGQTVSNARPRATPWAPIATIATCFRPVAGMSKSGSNELARPLALSPSRTGLPLRRSRRSSGQDPPRLRALFVIASRLLTYDSTKDARCPTHFH